MAQERYAELLTLPEYEYSTLPEGSWIRVAVLQPYINDVKDTIHIYFEHVQIDDPSHKPYVALSYAWGGNTLQKSIICEGQSLKITPNLMSALYDIRQSGQAVYVWADAVCIDQSEEGVIERQQQVGFMDTIFAQASQVLISLGTFSAQEQDVVSLISKFAQIDFVNLDISGCKSFAEANDYLAKVLKHHALPDMESRFWSGLRHLLERPWFTRLWIVQEYAVARNVSFITGHNMYMSAETFTKGAVSASWYHGILVSPLRERLISKGYTTTETVALWIPRLSWQHGYYIPIFQLQRILEEVAGIARASTRFREIVTFRQLHQARTVANEIVATRYSVGLGLDHHRIMFRNPWWKHRKHTFFVNYVRTRQFAATDSRDRVFALLGLCSEKGIPQLRVDYRSPPKHLAERISVHLINRGHGVYMVTAMSLSTKQNTHGWRVLLGDGEGSAEDQLCKLVNSSGQFELNLFRAGGYAEQIEVLTDAISHRPLLSVAGICIGQLDTICTIKLPPLVLDIARAGHLKYRSLSWWEGFKSQIKWYRDAVSWLQEMESWIRSYRNQSDALELECWRTLSCGITFNARGERELIAARPDQFDPAQAILKCKDAYSSTWSLFWRFMNQNVALPWQHLSTSLHMQLSIDTRGRLCTVPAGSEVSDLVCIFKGFPLPFILRPTSKGTYQLQGACYVKGVMDGDFFEETYPVNPMNFVLESGPDVEDE